MANASAPPLKSMARRSSSSGPWIPKPNEIPCLKELLKDLDLRGALVTADALNTQKSTAAHVVEEKQADYLLVVKENQPKLFDKLARLARAPEGFFSPSGHHPEPGPRPA